MHERYRAHSFCYFFPAALLLLLIGIPHVPASAQQAQPSDAQYVRITRKSVRVRRDIDVQSAMVGVADAGQRFRLLDYTEDAWKIAFVEGQKPVEAWINRENAVLERTTSSVGVTLKGHWKSIALVAGILLGLAVLIFAANMITRRVRERAAARITSDKLLIIISTQPKDIRYSLSNTMSTIEKCFAEIGFSIQRMADLNGFDQRIKRRAPDVILVDWAIGASLADELEISLGATPDTIGIPVVYYNAPAEVAAQRRPRVRNVYYLGVEFSDRDVLKLIQPHALGTTQTTIVRDSTPGSAISGEISEGGLNQVFQLLEIGQKTGCLFVSQEQPYGMVFFDGGNPVFATTRSLKGHEAVYNMLDLKSGMFRFAPDKKPPERNCTISTMGVLMEWARIKDEASRA